LNPIAIFYHGLFCLGDPPQLLPRAVSIVRGQMWELARTGLLDVCSELHVGLNGGEETGRIARTIIPPKAKVHLHGLKCRNECRTLLLMQEWVRSHRGQQCYVLYFHCKGATKPAGDVLSAAWLRCMTRHAVLNWRRCVQDLDSGYEAVGSHWLAPPKTPEKQYIFAGNFFWVKASFLATIPSLMERDRIKESGIDSLESRYEAEVILGNGARPPIVRDYHPVWPTKIGNCA